MTDYAFGMIIKLYDDNREYVIRGITDEGMMLNAYDAEQGMVIGAFLDKSKYRLIREVSK